MTLAELRADNISHYDTDDDEYYDDASAEEPVEDGRILVVDDDPNAATLMRRLIERDGFSSVDTAADGRRALDMMRAHPPYVVVLDVHLPHLDGYAVLREIVRSDESTGHPTGVLAVSGDPTPATAQSMLWAGADDFLPRPFDSAEFTTRVRRLANRTRSLRGALAYSQFLEHRAAPADELGGLRGTRTTLRPPRSIRASKLIDVLSSRRGANS
jgi:DNA-binding response OmpR family regulator